jgi:cytidylate kinase
MLHPVIAIDGPAASGKSTVSRHVSKQIGFTYVDTGAMYRAMTWRALDKGVDTKSREAMKQLVAGCKFETSIEAGKLIVRLDGQDPDPHIRSEQVNANVSAVSAVPEVREFLVIRQRQLRLQAPLVVEGRDIGTVVFPDTLYKFFIDADPEVRAQRRAQEGQVDSLAKRDAQDRSRQVAPLIRAADAELIDSGSMDAQAIAELIIKRSREKGLKAGETAASPVVNA